MVSRLAVFGTWGDRGLLLLFLAGSAIPQAGGLLPNEVHKKKPRSKRKEMDNRLSPEPRGTKSLDKQLHILTLIQL